MIFGFGYEEEQPRRRKSFGKKERDALFALQGGRCMYCGKKEREATYFEIDHKTPVARNGSDSLSNLQLLCGPCNKRKGALTDGQFRRAYGLTPASKAKKPPTRVIPQSKFEKITKEIAAKTSQKRRRAAQTPPPPASSQMDEDEYEDDDYIEDDDDYDDEYDDEDYDDDDEYDDEDYDDDDEYDDDDYDDEYEYDDEEQD